MTAGTDHVRLADDAPRARTLVANLDVALRNPNLHVVDIEHDVVFRRILDDAVPRAAAQSLPFRAIAAAACPPDVSHASLVRVPEWRPAGRPDTSCSRRGFRPRPCGRTARKIGRASCR